MLNNLSRSPLMSIRHSFLALALAAAGAFVFSGTAHAGDGEDMNVHNKTGHEVLVFMFDGDASHLDESGGTQFAHLKNGESAVAHVPHCKFSILLVDHDDVWHAELHDCHSNELTFTKDTGHAKKKH
jgi:hypothetical protein